VSAAGAYYWSKAERVESVRVRLEELERDDGPGGKGSLLTVRGGEEALDRLARSLRLAKFDD
jgi:hypothetical protein